MSVLKFPLLFVGSKGGKNIYALFDSGDNLSCVNPDFVDEITEKQPLGRVRKLATAGEGHYIEVKYRATLDFYVNDVLLSDEFLVVPALVKKSSLARLQCRSGALN